MQKSIFSKIINREIKSEIIAENDNIIVIKDINPQAPIHLLIIPKKEFENIATMKNEESIYGQYIFEMANYLSKTIPGANNFKLLINNGKEAGQCIFHIHAHFLSGL